jgi:hypothetical protein
MILGALQQRHLEWLNLEKILPLIKSRFELRHEAILPKENAAAKFEVVTKSDLGAELEIIRGSGFIQNIDLYSGEKSDLRASRSSLKMPGCGRSQIQREVSPGNVRREN